MTKEDKVLYRTIDDILWFEWDPIGLNDNENVRDEYQGYTPQIFSLKKRGADLNKIAQQLYEFETENMGMMGNKSLIFAHCKEVAQKIIDL